MAVEIMIKRKVTQGEHARVLTPLILRMRALATCQPGYISGETLRNVDEPEECLVVSKWDTIEHWQKWLNSKERKEIQKKIDDLTGGETEYKIYEPLVLWGSSRLC